MRLVSLEMNEQKTEYKKHFNQFQVNFPCLSLLKTTENLKYSDTYRGIKGSVDQNRAKFHLVITIRMNELNERIFINLHSFSPLDQPDRIYWTFFCKRISVICVALHHLLVEYHALWGKHQVVNQCWRRFLPKNNSIQWYQSYTNFAVFFIGEMLK